MRTFARLLPAAALLLAGCNRELSVPVASTLAVSPPVAQVAPRGAFAFAVSGGRGPYRIDPASLEPADYPVPDVSGGTVTFHADARGGVQVAFVILDAGSGRVRVSVTVGDALAIAPTASVVVANDRFTFGATGGQTPYTFSVAAPAGGVVDPAGVYAAGRTGGQDRVVVTDANGSTATALVSISPPLALYPATVTLAPGSVFYFQAVGGRQPYAWDPVDGLVGTIDGAGRLTVSTGAPATPAGSAGTDVAVTDGLTTAHARVVVTAPLAAPPVPTFVLPGRQLDLLASGGQPPYRFAYGRHGNLSAGSLAPGGHYVAGPNAMQADRLEVTDGLGTVVAFDVRVGPTALGPGDYAALFQPPTLGWQTFAARAGHLFIPSAHLHLGADGVPGAEALSGGALRDVTDFNGDGLPDLLIDSTATTDAVVNMYTGTPAGALTYFGGGVPVATGSGGAVVMPGPTFPTSLKPGPAYTLVAGAPCASPIFTQPLYVFQFGLAGCGAAVSPNAASYLVSFGAAHNDSAAASIGANSSSLWVDFFHYTMIGNTTPSLPTAPSLSWTLAPPFGVSILGAYGGPGPFAVDLRGTGRATDLAFLIGSGGTDYLIAALGAGAGGPIPAELQLGLSHAARPNVFAGPYRNRRGSVLIDDGVGGLRGWVMDEPTPGSYAWSTTPFTLPNVGRLLGAGDLDGDGDFDLVELDAERNIVFAQGDAAGSFDGLLDFAVHRGTRFRAGPSPGAFQPLAGRLDADGRDDLVITQPGDLRVVAGAVTATGQPALALELDDPSDVSPTPVALVDLDGDGAQELLGIDETMALVSRAWDGQRFGPPLPVGGIVATGRATPPVPVDLGGSGAGLDLLIPDLASARIDLLAFDPGPVATTALDLSGVARILDVAFVDLDADTVLDAVLLVAAGKGVELQWAAGSGTGASFRFAAPTPITSSLTDPAVALVADPARHRALAVSTSGLPAVTFVEAAGATTVSLPTAGLPYCASTAGQLASIGGVPHLLTILQHRGDAACGAGTSPYELQLAAVPLLAGSTIGTPGFTRIGGDGVAASWLTPDLDGDGTPELVYWFTPWGPSNTLAPVLHVWRRVPGTATFAP